MLAQYVLSLVSVCLCICLSHASSVNYWGPGHSGFTFFTSVHISTAYVNMIFSC